MKITLCFIIRATLVTLGIIVPLIERKPPALVVALPSPEPSPGLANSKQRHFLMPTKVRRPHARRSGPHGGIPMTADETRKYAEAMSQVGEVAKILKNYKHGARSGSTSSQNLRQGRA
uniref:Uncharacterized protein n=1 Tax=Rhipicephalus zambeziensis TaxID=60191 RepID=A0A224Z1F9_9ACAR